MARTVFAAFDTDGRSPRFWTDDAYPPVAVEVRERPAGAADDVPEDEWPLVRKIVRRNDAIPAEAVEIAEEQWLDLVLNPERRQWNGREVLPCDPPVVATSVPAVISDRQFAQALALAGTITEAEALAWAARGELPQAMEDALDHIPDKDGQRFGARMMLAAATSYERHLPLTEQLGALLTNPATGKPYDAAALDALWIRAAAL